MGLAEKFPGILEILQLLIRAGVKLDPLPGRVFVLGRLGDADVPGGKHRHSIFSKRYGSDCPLVHNL